MASVMLKAPPPVAPGAGVTEALRRGLEVIYSEAVLYNDTSPKTVFDVPANTEIIGFIVDVQTAFNGTVPSIALGVSGTTQRHVATNDVNVAAIGLTLVQKPFNYTADAALIATIVPGGGTAGKIVFGCMYRPNSNK